MLRRQKQSLSVQKQIIHHLLRAKGKNATTPDAVEVTDDVDAIEEESADSDN